jgi:hypothetical protein
MAGRADGMVSGCFENACAINVPNVAKQKRAGVLMKLKKCFELAHSL